MADLITSGEATAAVPALADRSDLAALISAASSRVEAYLRRTFGTGTVYTDYLDGNGLGRLHLSRRPVGSVGTVVVNDSALDNSDGDAWTVDTGTGALYRGTGQQDHRLAQSWPIGHRNVVVTYTVTDPVPNHVKQATIVMTQYLADTAGKSGAIMSEKLGDYSYTMSNTYVRGNLPPNVVALLSSDERMVIE